MTINANTRVSELIKANKEAIEVIASINKHFEKLRNPILRKVLAPRVSIAEAAKIGGTTVDVFFEKLKAIGFECDENTHVFRSSEMSKSFLINEDKIIEFDVRPILANGEDPLNRITQVLKSMSKDFTLRLINSFEPLPLVRLLESKGYYCKIERVADNMFIGYFKLKEGAEGFKLNENNSTEIFSKIEERFKNKIVLLDVRDMEMPQPMVSILEVLTELQPGFALRVLHKRVPQFLLPHLIDRNFVWTYRNNNPDFVELIIYKE
jgi:uncharacterized protein (DUF2249 family)